MAESVVQYFITFKSYAVSISVVQIAAAWLFPGGSFEGIDSLDC